VSQPALEEQFEPTAGDSVEAARARSSWELFRHRFRQDKAAMAGACILLVLVVLALSAPLFAKLTGHGPNDRFPDQMLTADIGLPKGPTRTSGSAATRSAGTCSTDLYGAGPR
jgi:hypothetical protein